MIALHIAIQSSGCCASPAIARSPPLSFCRVRRYKAGGFEGVLNSFVDGKNQLVERVVELLKSVAAPAPATVHKVAAELKATGVKILDLSWKGQPQEP